MIPVPSAGVTPTFSWSLVIPVTSLVDIPTSTYIHVFAHVFVIANFIPIVSLCYSPLPMMSDPILHSLVSDDRGASIYVLFFSTLDRKSVV